MAVLPTAVVKIEKSVGKVPLGNHKMHESRENAKSFLKKCFNFKKKKVDQNNNK